MEELNKLDGEIDVRCKEYIGTDWDKIEIVRNDKDAKYEYAKTIETTCIALSYQVEPANYQS